MAIEKFLGKNGWCCAAIAFFALLLWGQSVRYSFVWDDGLYITENKSLRSLANIPKFFYSQEAQSSEVPSISYRPLRNTFYAVLYALSGKNPPQAWMFHLANILWHAAAAILLFLVALALWDRMAIGASTASRLAALFVALGFAASPVNSEAVCWAKCVDDLMAAVFVLAAARSLLKWNPGGRGFAAALGWFLLAVFSKDSAAPFAVAVFFILYGFHKLPWRRSALLTAPFLLVMLFYVALQRCVMGHLSQCPPLSGSYFQTLIDMFPVGWEYWRLLWGIPPFCVDYIFMLDAPPHPFLSAGVIGGILLILFFCALAVWLWRRAEWRVAAFGLIWVALFLLPVSNLVPMMQYMAERFLYLPSMGFFLALGCVFLNLSRLRGSATVAVAAGLLVIWAGTAFDRMSVWQDPFTLFFRTEFEHPGIKRVQQNALSAVMHLPQVVGEPGRDMTPQEAEIAISTLQRVRQIYPNNDKLITQLGLTVEKTGRWDYAAALLELAARQNPTLPDRWVNLGSAYVRTGQPGKAREACEQALRLNPKFPQALQLKAILDKEPKPASEK